MTVTSGKFRKKPVEIEAFQWNGEPPFHWPSWARENLDIRYEISNLQVNTARGAVRANKGDWIIHQADGEVYPCPGPVFERNYESV